MHHSRFFATTIAAVAIVALSSCGHSRVGRLAGSDPEWYGGVPNAPVPIRPLVPRGRNLLPNGSFERDGQPSLEGWRVNNTALTSIVPEPAPGGGSFSLQLEADWAPTSGFVTAPIPGARRGGVFRLSAYVRAVDADGGGEVALA